ncbi:hypothetical protein ALI22I_04980 [Saccharothrix sp. ALI-22-I]|uniref:hypothetical protein n=1 Tax=Saccharothrix sp. ALI-22-I TaxID=1933778 RepID=UPI00097C6743|nr:hypothetical protein [Saccharothrix sp. ALI-22-I]ONI92293.1 hypothetical protein ALI22I_04980 [Saccharothrix sp. ALI-22-I]
MTALGALTLAAPPAHAADINVPCDPAALVQAVAAANATDAPDTLSLTPNCVYALTAPADTAWNAGLPTIRGKLTINGNHSTIARVQTAPQFRIISNWGDLTLNEVTIAGGHAPDGVGANSYGDGNSGGAGGGIQNWGPLTITNSVITGNSAGAGAPGADATATASAGRGGLGGFGGGIASYSSTPVALTITNSSISNNTTGASGRGGNGTGTKPGGRGGSGGFGGGIDVTSGTILRITGSSITGNIAADGAQGGSGGATRGGGGDGGSGGTGAGVFIATREGQPLNPVITGTTITGNRAGRGGDAGVAGAGGYAGWAGFGGGGGGLGVFYDTLTLDGGTVSDNAAGEPGAGSSRLPASGGGIYTLRGHVTLVNGAVVSGNRPDNCESVADVPGCVNDLRAAGVQRTDETTVRDRRADDLAVAEQAASSAMPGK